MIQVIVLLSHVNQCVTIAQYIENSQSLLINILIIRSSTGKAMHAHTFHHLNRYPIKLYFAIDLEAVGWYVSPSKYLQPMQCHETHYLTKYFPVMKVCLTSPFEFFLAVIFMIVPLQG